MGASITLAGENLIAQKQAAHAGLKVARFIFANIPGLDTSGPVDRTAGKPAAAQIVYSYLIPDDNAGYVNPNQVVYSAQIGSDVGDWDFNWIGLESAEGTLFAVAYVPFQQKRRNIPPLQIGNNLTRNFLVVFDGAQALTGITIDANTWQHDFTVRLAGIDERERQSNRDIFGRACFFGSALQLEKVGAVYQLKPGTAYVEGVRLQRSAALAVVPSAFPTTAWLDVALQRELNDVVASWNVVWGAGKVDYVDNAGVQHYCVAIADLPNSNTITDSRSVEDIAGPLVKHFASVDYVVSSISTRQPSHENLTAFAELAGAADKLPYFSDAKELNMATITAKARSLLGIADEAAMRKFLGLVKQSSATDDTEGSVLLNGAFGLGRSAIFETVDANRILKPGFYATGAAALNNPSTNGVYIICNSNGGTSVAHHAIDFVTGKQYTRKLLSSIWSLWVETWHTGNLTPAELSPPGAVVHFARSSAPGGWLKANGAEISRASYAALFAAIGTQFGAGDGNSTFKLPDLRGEFVRGFDDARGVDSERTLGSWQADDFRAHTHKYMATGGGSLLGPVGDTNNAMTENTSTVGGAETRPRNIALLACIKY